VTDWRPSCDLEMLRRRSVLRNRVRGFFAERGYLEVETPVLSRDVVVDAHLEPFVAHWEPDSGTDRGAARHERFLQTSPEFLMKRLVAAGAEAIWQTSRVFRQGERGRWHEPEFTLLEWYRAGDDHHAQMTVTEDLAVAVCDRAGRELVQPFERLGYDAAFERHAGTPVLALDVADLIELAARHGVHLPDGLARDDRDGLLNLLLATLVEPHLGRERPTLLYDYPVSQAALARIRHDDPPVAERFELYIDGLELANGYHELTDAAELRRRNAEQNRLRVRDGRRALPEESRLLAAMEAGLPPCAGVALGFDRLIAVAVGATSLAEVLPFPFDRA
jgi:elongation factor P--(R)-beta-lysine ligase